MSTVALKTLSIALRTLSIIVATILITAFQRPVRSSQVMVGRIPIEMAPIPAGSFLMGSPVDEEGRDSDEGPQRLVTVQRFAMSKYEVTQKLWIEIMGNNNNPSRFKGDNLPVENVSWNEVQEFCQLLNQRLKLTGSSRFRLPTEAEWEYAARARTTSRYSFGDDEESIKDFAWYIENSSHKTHPVGEKRPNKFDLYDMHGNVWEWCQDISTDSCERASRDTSSGMIGRSQAADRVVRGGSWRRDAVACRTAARDGYAPGYRNSSLGFRLARTLPSAQIP